MNWKDILMRHLIRLRKTGGLVSLGLLTVNQALLIAQTVAWRGLDPWIVVPSVATALFVIAIAISWGIWAFGDGFHHETAAQVAHNPVQVYALNPFQEVEYETRRLPMMRALHGIAEAVQADHADELADAIEDWEGYVERGHISREEYAAIAPHLMHHYLATEGGRL